MRCSVARERITRVGHRQNLSGEPSLASHLEACPRCAEVLGHHLLLIAALGAHAPLPDFRDLGPLVVSRLDGSRSLKSSGWRSTAVAALAAVALTLGYLFGQMSAGGHPSADSMAATYQAALTGLSASSTELALLETGLGDEGAVPVRSAP
jgi:hypothetical protein